MKEFASWVNERYGLVSTFTFPDLLLPGVLSL
jgi:hypothetical protein